MIAPHTTHTQGKLCEEMGMLISLTIVIISLSISKHAVHQAFQSNSEMMHAQGGLERAWQKVKAKRDLRTGCNVEYIPHLTQRTVSRG